MNTIILTRSDKNPILTPLKGDDHWWEENTVFNVAATVHDEKIYLVYRAMGKIHYSLLGLAILSDPETVEKRFPYPMLAPQKGNEYEQFGLEDPRITKIGDTYYIVYVGFSVQPHEIAHVDQGRPVEETLRVRCSMISTRDFKTFDRHGVILPDIHSKDPALFPEKIKGKYVLMHRVMPDIYLSFSDSLNYFDKGSVLCTPREGYWDNHHIGGGAQPIKTPYGWLVFYHGVHQASPGSKFVYSLGILLLDLEDPMKVLYRSSEPILSPKTDYETKGYVDSVVFTCGAIEWNESFYVYYGAADSCTGVAYVSKKELYDYLEQNLGIITNGRTEEEKMSDVKNKLSELGIDE